VLVVGETGSGKELVAQAIHRESERRGNPFVAIDCGAIPDHLLESELFGHEKVAFTGAERTRRGQLQLAQGGTFFLDEVGNLPMNLQAKLLRVLESRQVQAVGAERAAALDVRFVAATNNDLQARASSGLFRADLYFRLAQYTIAVPALRDRPVDIPYLANRFLAEASVELRRPVQQIVPSALALLVAHPWSRNVRELHNIVRQAVLKSRDLMIGEDAVRRHAGAGLRSIGKRRLGFAGVSFRIRLVVQCLEHGCDMLFVALGANTVAEVAVGMANNVVFDAVPIVLIVANLPTVRANGEKFVELFHFGERGREFTVGLGKVGGALAHPAIQVDIQFLNFIVRTQRLCERLLEFGILFFELGHQHGAVLLDDESVVRQFRRTWLPTYGGNLQRIQNIHDRRGLRDKLVRTDRVAQAHIGRRRVRAAVEHKSQ